MTNREEAVAIVNPKRIGGAPSLDALFGNGVGNGQDVFSRTATGLHAEIQRLTITGKKPTFTRG
jgi:hypothetical protein